MRKPYKGREYVSPYRMEVGSRVVEGRGMGKGIRNENERGG